MPCPLCFGADDPFIRNSCRFCYPKFEAEKEEAKKQDGIMPQIIIDGDALKNQGFNAWRVGKLQQRQALKEGKSDDEAERIGFAAMEEAAKKEREGLARQQARIAKERADLNRLFRHTT